MDNWDLCSNTVEFESLVGKTILRVVGKRGDDQLVFHLSDGKRAVLFHDQDCCESVYLEDVTGDFEDICGSPILRAFENTQDDSEGSEGLCVYTFYTLTTFKGSVTLRWMGESNGYYSVDVNCAVV